MSAHPKPKKVDVILQLQTLAKAARKHFANQTLFILGKPMATDDLAALLERQATAMQDADSLHTAWLNAVRHNRDTAAAQIDPAIAGLKAYATAMLGPSSTGYAAFGFHNKKPRRTLATKVAAAAQSLATRAARHTMGTKQRKAVKGVVKAAVPPR